MPVSDAKECKGNSGNQPLSTSGSPLHWKCYVQLKPESLIDNSLGSYDATGPARFAPILGEL